MGLPFSGEDATIWGCVSAPKAHSPDLVTLCPRLKEDLFSNWLLDRAITYLLRCGCARFMKKSPKHGLIGYEETSVLKITYWITNILASLIPIASIAVLYSVHSMPARLAIIGAFNVLLSVSLSYLANAKRAEVFAVTAA